MSVSENVAYVDHPLFALSFIERRLYQIRLAGIVRDGHTLICLPTSLGKTTASLLVTVQRLHDVGGESLFLAPTKPLVQQYADFYREALTTPDDGIVVFTGDVRPDDWAELWQEAQTVIATPQVIENDLIGNRISLRDVTHLAFDECHRMSGDCAYVYIAERYHAAAENPFVTGTSASSGGDEGAILEICENLGIVGVKVMTEEGIDVSEYTYDTDAEWSRIQFPDGILEIHDALNEVITDRLEKLKQLSVTKLTEPGISQKELNQMCAELQRLINADKSEGYKGVSTHAGVMKLRRVVELVETQSVEPVRRYLERQCNAARSPGAPKASQRLVAEPKVREAMWKAESSDGLHPKFRKTCILLMETLGIRNDERVIAFTESRDTAEALTEFSSESFPIRWLVGQGDREGSDGITQNEQQEIPDKFRNGEFKVLVSISAMEEGPGVPEVDLALLFEPVPTAIRSIQRKEWTGRQADGRVVVLLAEDIRDEAYFQISRRRGKTMQNELRNLKGAADNLEVELDPSQRDLSVFTGDDASSAGSAGSSTRNEEVDVASEGNANGASAIASSASNGRTAIAAATDSGGQSGFADFGPSDEALARVDDGDDSHGEDTNLADSGDDPTSDVEGGEVDDLATVVAASTDGEDTVEIVVDQRELDSNIARTLSKREDLTTRLETLTVGDYIFSDCVVAERKSISDFLDTLTGGDRSIFEQIAGPTRHYVRPPFVVEGRGLYEECDIHPGMIHRALPSVAVDLNVSVLFTEDKDDTVELLATIAIREQTDRERAVSVHGGKSAKTLDEQQEYVVFAIADIDPVTTRTLLETFGSVEAVMTVNEGDLKEVHGIGQVTAE